jgi:hypothetical protein
MHLHFEPTTICKKETTHSEQRVKWKAGNKFPVSVDFFFFKEIFTETSHRSTGSLIDSNWGC